MTPTTFLGIRLPAEVKAALAGAAANADRSMSWMVVMIVTGWLRENGHLAKKLDDVVK